MERRIVVTTGDPRGIGPEVVARALTDLRSRDPSATVEVIGPEGPLDLDDLSALAERHRAGAEDGDAEAGEVAARSIERAAEIALAGEARAVVTAPIHKPSMHAAGRDFPGHTEMLARVAGVERVGMLMVAERTRLGPPLRVLLATTHLALRNVPDAVTSELLVGQTALLHESLRRDWGVASPRIGLCALNPHASDGGLFGDEEERVISPAVDRLRTDGVQAEGPLPADTVFTRALDGAFDAVVAPYHDVGMAAFKTVSFGAGVNVTLGLPFVRTSPDHGTAFDIAGSGRADPSSMREALRLAILLSERRFDTPPTDV